MFTSSNISQNYTPEEIEEYLSALQHESTLAFIPALIYLSLLIVVGSVGNCLVLVVYSTKMTRTPLRIYMISMAIYDLPTNLLVIPGDIYDTFHVWDFDKPLVCKLRRYFNATCVLSSIFVLVAIASTRYKMVCAELDKQVTITRAKLSSFMMLVVGLILAIPYGLINGSQTIATPTPGIFGHFCQVDDYYVKTIWPTLNSAFFILIFCTCCLTMCVFYARIGCRTWKHRKIRKCLQQAGKTSRSEESDFVLENSYAFNNTDRQNEPSILGTPQSIQQLPSEELVKDRIGKSRSDSSSHKEEITFSFKEKDNSLEVSVATSREKKSLAKDFSFVREENLIKIKKRRSIFGRTSWMMITVSLVFVGGFLPFLGLNFYKTAAPERYAALEGASLSMYQLFIRSYLLNSAVNPIVYSLLDGKFRKESLKLLNCFK